MMNRRNFLALTAASAASGCGLITNVSEGKMVGIVVSLAPKGWMNRTWEGEMALGNMRAGRSGGGTTSTFDFHVDDLNVVKQLQDAMEHIKPIEVTYTETAGHNPFFRESSNTIVAMKDLSAELVLPSNPTMSRAETLADAGPSGVDARNGLTLRCFPAPSPVAPK